MKEQDNKEGIPTMHSDTNEFRGFHEDHSSPFSNFDDKNHNRFGIESNRHEGFDGFESNTFSNPVQHTSLRRGGHHHKHHHHQHSHKHTNDHKHAHKHLHEQSHEQEKPMHCVYCDMRFSSEISLKKHSRIHKI